MTGEQRSGYRREYESKKAQKSSRQRSHGHGPFEKRTHPTKKKSPKWAEAAVQINIRASRFGKRRAQFGITEGAEKHDESAEKPGHEHQKDGTYHASHVAGHQKDAGA